MGPYHYFETIIPFHPPILLPLWHIASYTSAKLLPLDEAHPFELYALVPFLIIYWILESGCLEFVDCWVILNILESVFLWSPFHDRYIPWRCSIQLDTSSIWVGRCMSRVGWYQVSEAYIANFASGMCKSYLANCFFLLFQSVSWKIFHSIFHLSLYNSAFLG